MRAQPFLTPALTRNLGETGPYVRKAMAARARRQEARKARIAAQAGAS
jgi:hypothetical protein